MKSTLICACLLALLSGACSKNIDTTEAVKAGILKEIGKNITVSAMDVNVVSVSFRGNEADAVVSFAPKGGPTAMTIPYTMTKKDNEWHIAKRGTMQGHAAPGAAGQGAAPQAGEMALPPGHAPIGGDTGGGGTALPPGHPSVNPSTSGTTGK